MPWHVAIDQASERRLGKLQIGTTRRGIGPAYADKAARLGIRVQDLLDPKILRQKIEVALAEKNVWLERVYGAAPLDLEEVAARLRGLRAAAAAVHRRHVAARRPRAARRASACCSRARRGRCSTSTTARIRSSPRRTRSPARRRPGSGSGRPASTRVIGVAKAYVTRVGEGPFPTEIEGAGPGARARARRRVRHGHRPRAPLRLARPRRAALRGAAERDHLARADEARRALARSPSCRSACATGCATGRRPTSSRRTRATSTTAEPVYETLPGWEEPLDEIDDVAALPEAPRATSSSSSAQLGVEVSLSAPALRARARRSRRSRRPQLRRDPTAYQARARAARTGPRGRRGAVERPRAGRLALRSSEAQNAPAGPIPVGNGAQRSSKSVVVDARPTSSPPSTSSSPTARQRLVSSSAVE